MQNQIFRQHRSLAYSLVFMILAVGSLAHRAYADQFHDLSHYFSKANVVSDPERVACTLSGGVETNCFRITVVPEPTTHTPGPWCPGNILDSADSGGIWLENGNVHDVSGEFIENMATFYADTHWQLFDSSTGNINVTDTYEKCEGAAKPDVDPEFQQHCVECALSYLEDDKTITYTIPLVPVMADQPLQTRTSGSGVAFDGVRLDGPAPVSDILGNYTLAPFDDCGGHINLHVGYHYHAATDCLEKAATNTDHGSAVGLAMDGHLILARLTNDGVAPAELDQCGGHYTDSIGYHYHAGEPGSNAIVSCLVAETGCVAEERDAECDASASTRRDPPGGRGQGGNNGNGVRPDFAVAAEKLGVSENELMNALGAPPPDFEKAAKTLGISIQELEGALRGR